MAKIGPTANLPGTARRSGQSGTVLQAGNTLGEVIAVEWNVAIEQIDVVIAGAWRTEKKPGREERAGTFRFQDVDDRWALKVWRFVRARRDGDRSAANFPEFDLVTKLNDIGAPMETRWSIEGCILFEYSGGHSQDDSLIIREIPFSFREERPLQAFEYSENGQVAITAV
jgi:hypothetical protein